MTPCCADALIAGYTACPQCGTDLTEAQIEYARLRQPSLTWTGRNAIPIGPFRDLTRAARRALAKVWWSR